jgi:hypothetical protein
MIKFEYKRELYIAVFDSIDVFNQEGQNGWLVVNIERVAAPDKDNYVYVTYAREFDPDQSKIDGYLARLESNKDFSLS